MALAGEKVVYAGETVTIPLPGRRGQADAAVRHAVPGRPDLPGHALAADAPAHRGDRRRLAGHELRPRGRGGLPHRPRRGAGARRAHARRPRRLPGRRGGVRGRRRTSSRAWSTPGGRGSRSAWAAWARRRRTTTTPPTAARAGARSPRGCGNAGIDGDRAARPRSSPTRWCSPPRSSAPSRWCAPACAVWQAAGVDTVRLYPAGETLDDQVATLGRAIELVREISTPEPARSAPPAGTPGAGGSGPPAP